METSSFSLLDFFVMGGPLMWPLLAFSIAAVAISLERLVYFWYHNLRMDDLALKVSEFVENGDYKGAEEYLAPLTKRRMGARIFLAMLKRCGPGLTERRLERAAETEAMSCVGSLENGFNFLIALGSISPLTGFLGTVTGMIGAFKSIAEADEVNAQIVAGGIYEALITTVFGLIIAITAMVFHLILSHMTDRFAGAVEQNCSQLIAQIAERESDTLRANEAPKAAD